MDMGKTIYHLKIINQETLVIFRSMIEEWFSEEDDSSYNDFIEALLSDDIDSINDFMNEIALQSFSFFDSGKQPSKKTQPERFYHRSEERRVGKEC